MAAMVLGAEVSSRWSCRAAPEWKPATRNALIERGSDVETIVGVALVVLDEPRDLVPYRAPWRPCEPQSGGKALGVAEREVETEQNPLAARCRCSQPFAEQALGGVARRRVREPFTVGCVPADPDAVAAAARHRRGAPIDHDEGVEH